jgi:hypothetical protein
MLLSEVVTDRSAVWLSSIKDPTGRLRRWSIYLQAYELEIIYRTGKMHTNAERRSRKLIDCKKKKTSQTISNKF